MRQGIWTSDATEVLTFLYRVIYVKILIWG